MCSVSQKAQPTASCHWRNRSKGPLRPHSRRSHVVQPMSGLGRRGRPDPILLEQCVCQHDQLTHGGRDRDFEWFARLSEATVEPCEITVPAHRDCRRHVKDVARGDPSAADHLPASQQARVPVHRDQSREGCGLGRLGRAQLFQLDKEHRRGDGTDPRHRGQDLEAARRRRIGL